MCLGDVLRYTKCAQMTCFDVGLDGVLMWCVDLTCLVDVLKWCEEVYMLLRCTELTYLDGVLM